MRSKEILLPLMPFLAATISATMMMLGAVLNSLLRRNKIQLTFQPIWLQFCLSHPKVPFQIFLDGFLCALLFSALTLAILMRSKSYPVTRREKMGIFQLSLYGAAAPLFVFIAALGLTVFHTFLTTHRFPGTILGASLRQLLIAVSVTFVVFGGMSFIGVTLLFSLITLLSRNMQLSRQV